MIWLYCTAAVIGCLTLAGILCSLILTDKGDRASGERPFRGDTRHAPAHAQAAVAVRGIGETQIEIHARVAREQQRTWQEQTAARARAAFVTAVIGASRLADFSHLEPSWQDETGSFRAFYEAGEAA